MRGGSKKKDTYHQWYREEVSLCICMVFQVFINLKNANGVFHDKFLDNWGK